MRQGVVGSIHVLRILATAARCRSINGSDVRQTGRQPTAELRGRRSPAAVWWSATVVVSRQVDIACRVRLAPHDELTPIDSYFISFRYGPFSRGAGGGELALRYAAAGRRRRFNLGEAESLLQLLSCWVLTQPVSPLSASVSIDRPGRRANNASEADKAWRDSQITRYLIARAI